MNDAGNQYLGAGVEVQAVAAPASPAAQEAWVGLGGVGQAEVWRTPLCHLLPPPHGYLASHAPTPAHLPPASISMLGREMPLQHGAWEMRPWASQSCRALPCPLPASGHLSPARPQVQGACVAAWGRCPLLLALPLQMWPAGGGLGHHIAFPGLPGPRASWWDES